jgi:hypothetical protein
MTPTAVPSCVRFLCTFIHIPRACMMICVIWLNEICILNQVGLLISSGHDCACALTKILQEFQNIIVTLLFLHISCRVVSYHITYKTTWFGAIASNASMAHFNLNVKMALI